MDQHALLTAPAERHDVIVAADVLPVFESRCVKCHGGEETEEGLVLTNHADALAGGWNGPVIEPGNVAGSYLVEQIESGEMPKKEPRLLFRRDSCHQQLDCRRRAG